MATTDTTSIPEKGNGGDSKIQSKAADREKQAYEQTIVGKEAAVGTAPGIYTNPQPGHQPSGKNAQHVKEEVTSVPEKNIGGDNKNRSKAVNRGKQAYNQTIIGKEAAAGLYGTATSNYTDLQPGEPRYLHVGDHVVVYSGLESGDTYGYKEAEEVNEGCEEDHYYRDYETPEDVHTYEGFEENHYSHDYDKPEDVYGYKDPEEKSFACRAKASVVVSVILATHITHGGRVALQQNGTMEFYGENYSAFDGFIVVKSTPTYLPFTKSDVTAKAALPTTATPQSTTDVNECTKHPCQYGHCEDQDGGYKCTCLPGWTGQNCQQDINECNGSPCQHGRCENTYGGYKCACSSGWTGQNCQQDVNECTRNPCQHGRCENTNGGYRCACSSGWTGRYCHQALRCQTGWSERNNHCYKLMRDKVHWSEAKSGCAKHGAILATIKDAGENNFIKGLIKNADKSFNRPARIGLVAERGIKDSGTTPNAATTTPTFARNQCNNATLTRHNLLNP
ncbi:hypothetical protein Bbelb_220520 [Branchiostoma belcheri]|nr:hypothetical protein Bbelb_220520 [Branchiostoma belcheri]